MTRRMDHNHTDKYQVSLCLYFETDAATYPLDKIYCVEKEVTMSIDTG